MAKKPNLANIDRIDRMPCSHCPKPLALPPGILQKHSLASCIRIGMAHVAALPQNLPPAESYNNVGARKEVSPFNHVTRSSSTSGPPTGQSTNQPTNQINQPIKPTSQSHQPANQTNQQITPASQSNQPANQTNRPIKSTNQSDQPANQRRWTNQLHGKRGNK